MITNGTADPQNYYRIKFTGVPHEVYEYGTDALNAINTAKDALANAHTPLYRSDLGSALVRPAVYKEWNHRPEQYTNGGQFIR